MKEAFEPFFKEKKEQMKVELINTLHLLLLTFFSLQLKPVRSDNVAFHGRCAKQTFSPIICEELVKLLTEYFDNVREAAQNLVLFIVRNYLPQGHLTQSPELEKALTTLRANALIGWSEGMRQQVKDAADMEAELSKHLFNDPQVFLKNIIAIMIDETHGRDTLVQIVKEFSQRMPFMLLNDYRIAVGTNSLRRIDVLRDLIFKV